MANCELSKFNDKCKEIAGVGSTSAIAMKDNLIFLPLNGKDNSNKKLDTADKVYNWGKHIKKKINTYFANKNNIYGDIAVLTKDPKGTYVEVSYTKELSNAIDYKNGILSDEAYDAFLEEDFKKRDVEGNQKFNSEGDVFYQTASNEYTTTSNLKLNTLLLEFAKANGVKVEFIDSLVKRFGGDYNAVFNTITKTITVAEGQQKLDTLPEEVGHATLEGLGEEHALVKRAYELVAQLPYQNELDPKYNTMYDGDQKKLIKEYAGKKLAEVIVNQYKGDPSLKNILQRIIKFFLDKFKSTDARKIEAIKEELAKLYKPLATQILSGNTIGMTFPDGASGMYAQVNTKVDKYQKQLNVFYKSRVTLRKKLRGAENRKDAAEISKYTEQLKFLEKSLERYNKTKDSQILYQLGEKYLETAEKFINDLESGIVNEASKDFSKKLSDTERVINSFNKFPGLANKAIELEDRWLTVTKKISLDLINRYRTEKESIDWDKIDTQKGDINRFTMGTGALVDLANYLGRTIGSLIKAAQNRISTAQKKLADEITDKVSNLMKWGNANGLSENQVYDLFIEEGKSTTHFVGEWSTEFYDDLQTARKEKDFNWIRTNTYTTLDGNKKIHIPINKSKYTSNKYKYIQKNKELKEFYDFYKSKISEAFDNLPIDDRSNFIPNVYASSIKDVVKTAPTYGAKITELAKGLTGVSPKTDNSTGYIENEDYSKDVLPLKYITQLDSKNKSRNLGEVLYNFGSFAITHSEMSDVLPKATLLQKHIEARDYTKSSNPTKPVAGLDSNLNTMVKKVIDMQIKGNKKLEEMKIPYTTIVDGKEVKKYILGSDVIDYGLKYNSILRIGLNPFNAIINWLVGDIGNIIEGFGGRFFNNKELQAATNLFIKDYYNKDSKLSKVVLNLNPLQELEDYQHAEELKFKKSIDGDKIKNLMYSPQRVTENFLQTRTMVAIMMHQKFPGTDVSIWEAFGDDGELKKEYKVKFKNSAEIDIFTTKLTDKIQRVNQMIHGRYSERDAAIIQQSVLWRVAFQFKKWIPAAIEQRFGKAQYDVRLGEDIEGRYRTFYKQVLKKTAQGEFANALTNMIQPIFNYEKAIAAGGLSEVEIYNMRKNMMEVTFILVSLLSYIALGWGDDDEKKKNPYYKMTMSTLDRVSGDLLYFINPAEANKLFKSPISLSNTVQDLVKVVTAIPSIFDDSKDKRKKTFTEKLAKVTPVAKPFTQVYDFFDAKKYKEYGF